jgi:hypothetical protein
LKFIQNFSEKKDVDIQSEMEKMQQMFDLKYGDLETKLKKLMYIEVDKETSSSISNNLLKDTVFKFKVIDFIMKFYELLSLTKIKFQQYVEKDLSREMFLDSLDFQILKEFDDWMKNEEKNSSNSSQKFDNSKDEDKLVNKSNQDNDSASSRINLERELVVTESVWIDHKTLLNPLLNQVDLVLSVKDKRPDQLMMDIQEPLILSFLFQCTVVKESQMVNQVKEATLLRSRILNTQSSKKNKFKSHKNLKKLSKSLSSGKKPSPFKFQTNISNYFSKKKMSGTKKTLGLKKLKMNISKEKEGPILHTPQLMGSNHQLGPPQIVKNSKIMVGIINKLIFRINMMSCSLPIPLRPFLGMIRKSLTGPLLLIKSPFHIPFYRVISLRTTQLIYPLTLINFPLCS